MGKYVESSLNLIKAQRSHLLFVLSDARPDRYGQFMDWYRGAYCRSLLELESVLSVTNYEQHHVDITGGQYKSISFRYLGICELSIDGAQAAGPIIDKVLELHAAQSAATTPATWLYFPIGEKVGRSPVVTPSMLTLAFANSVAGEEAEFREWYVTRHIRHALKVPALVSGMCVERTLFQKHGALEPIYKIIAMYEQEGSAESIVDSFREIPAAEFEFPALDISESHFKEWVYRPI